MSRYIGKYVAIDCSHGPNFHLCRMEFLYVIEETKKQVKAKESKDGFSVRTISKSQILGIVPASEVKSGRKLAMNIQNEYCRKRKLLYDEYRTKMLSIVD